MTAFHALPAMSVNKLRGARKLDHYLLAAYDSVESFAQRIVVVDPRLDAPTLILRPRVRTASRGNVLALAVPSLADLSLELAQGHTNTVTEYMGLRLYPLKDRIAGTHPLDLHHVGLPWAG